MVFARQVKQNNRKECDAGCTDPNAANFDPAAVVDDGTCNYIANTNEETGLSEDLRGYVTKTLSNVWSHNFKGDDTEPKDWGSTGYSYRGQRVSQRDIMRLVSYSALMTHPISQGMLCSKTSILLYRKSAEIHGGINFRHNLLAFTSSAVNDEEKLTGLISRSANGFISAFSF